MQWPPDHFPGRSSINIPFLLWKLYSEASTKRPPAIWPLPSCPPSRRHSLISFYEDDLFMAGDNPSDRLQELLQAVFPKQGLYFTDMLPTDSQQQSPARLRISQD